MSADLEFTSGQVVRFTGRNFAERTEAFARRHGPSRVKVISPGVVRLLADFDLLPKYALHPGAEAFLKKQCT